MIGYVKWFLIVSSLALASGKAFANEEPVQSAVNVLVEGQYKFQNEDGGVYGIFESNPSIDALWYVLGQKLGKESELLKEREQVISRAEKWRGDKIYWGVTPGGPPSLDITGVILLCYEKMGLPRSLARLQPSWSWFEKNGGVKKLNIATKMLLGHLNLAPYWLADALPENLILGAPKFFPLQISNTGLIRNFLIADFVWNYFEKANQRHLMVKKLNSDWYNDAGSSFFNEFSPTKFSRMVGLNSSNDFYAQSGLGWMVSHMTATGHWYTIYNSILNLTALKAATDAHVADFSKIIDLGWAGTFKWRIQLNDGTFHVQQSISAGWDTPQLVVALLESPYRASFEKQPRFKNAIEFINKTQIFTTGDWTILSPKLTAAGWGFAPEVKEYPDTDVTATNLEALYEANQYSSPQFNLGVQWLLGMQNSDGGFPAWEKGVSKIFTFAFNLLNPPETSDLSQSDVTSRIVRFFVKLQKNPATVSLISSKVMKNACDFILASRQQKKPSIWNGRWLVAYGYGTAESLDALLSAGCLPEKEAAESLNWLVSHQQKSGGWGESHESYFKNKYVEAEPTIIQTAYILNAFIAYETVYKKAHGINSNFLPNIESGMAFLIEKINQIDGIEKERSYTGVVANRLWYANYDLNQNSIALKVMNRYLKLKKL